MPKRMDKYEKTTTEIPTRSEKNKDLYKQIYNAYDEFENLIVPSNAKEIDISDLKKEISSRDEYRKIKDVEDITKSRIKRIDDELEIEEKPEEEEEEIYDINELLDKAVSTNKKDTPLEPTLSSGDYLKKLKIDKTKTNLEQVKEMYNSMEEDVNENETLLKTANLSLEILSDLKGVNENTAVSPQLVDDIDEIIASGKNEQAEEEEEDNEEQDESNENIEEDVEDYDFYSNNYKFSKKDFEGKKDDVIDKKVSKKNEDHEEDDDEEDDDDDGEGHSFLKIFLLVFGILLVVAIVAYLIIYFGNN